MSAEEVKSIPTLADDYAEHELKDSQEAKYKPEQKLNERVSIWRGKPFLPRC